jgi:capsular polysaccharide biosynthesis protein
MEKYFESSNIINLLWKWKFHLAVILLIAIVLSAIFSSPFFITPKFKSYAVAYPANVSEYSDESTSEQMFQMLQAQDIKDSVIAKFNLADHYEIERDYKYFRTAINYEYGQNVTINKTPYDAITIEVLDKDPEMAANMVSAIIDFYNRKIARLHKEKYLEVILMYEGLLRNKQRDIDSLKARLFQISREHGILSYEETTIQVMRGYLQTIMGSDKSNINMKEVNRLKKNLEEHGGEMIELVEEIKQEARTYADFKVEYEDAWRFYYADLTYCNVVTEPFPADKKSYPIRWLIVAITTLVTFFMAVIIIVIIENYRRVIKRRSNASID